MGRFWELPKSPIYITLLPEEAGWLAVCESSPSACAYGTTRGEAVRNAQVQALRAFSQCLLEREPNEETLRIVFEVRRE